MSILFVIFYENIASFDSNYYNTATITIVFTLSLVKTIFCLNCHNGLGGFFHRISDNKIGATYITALYSFNNLAYKWPGILIFSLVDYFGYKIVGLLSIIYCFFFYNLFKKSFMELDDTKESDWKIEENEGELELNKID